MQPQPGIDTLEVKEVTAIRQKAEHIGGLVIRQTDGTAGGCGVCLLELSFGVEQLRIADYGFLIESNVDYETRRQVRRPPPMLEAVAIPLPERERRRVLSPGTEVRSESYGGDEEENSNGDSNGIGKPSDVVAAEKTAIAAGGGGVHLPNDEEKREEGLEIERGKNGMVWSAMANGRKKQRVGYFGDSKVFRKSTGVT